MHTVRSLYLSCSIVFLLCAHQLSGQTAFREFSNAAGQTITARPVNVIGEEVRIEFEDGRAMNVSLDAFVEKDAAYLRDWAIMELARRERLLDVVVTRNEYEVKDSPEYEGYYFIKIENRSSLPLDLLKVEYRIFTKEGQAARLRDEARYSRQSGTLDFRSLSVGVHEIRKTESVRFMESELGQEVLRTGGGDSESKVKLIGIWAKIYYNGKQVHEYALPERLLRNEKFQ
jgi:hypothetical protein